MGCASSKKTQKELCEVDTSKGGAPQASLAAILNPKLHRQSSIRPTKAEDEGDSPLPSVEPLKGSSSTASSSLSASSSGSTSLRKKSVAREAADALEASGSSASLMAAAAAKSRKRGAGGASSPVLLTKRQQAEAAKQKAGGGPRDAEDEFSLASTTRAELNGSIRRGRSVVLPSTPPRHDAESPSDLAGSLSGSTNPLLSPSSARAGASLNGSANLDASYSSVSLSGTFGRRGSVMTDGGAASSASPIRLGASRRFGGKD